MAALLDKGSGAVSPVLFLFGDFVSFSCYHHTFFFLLFLVSSGHCEKNILTWPHFLWFEMQTPLCMENRKEDRLRHSDSLVLKETAAGVVEFGWGSFSGLERLELRQTDRIQLQRGQDRTGL